MFAGYASSDLLCNVICVKSRLLSGDFVANIKLLQHYPDDMNVEYLLQVAQDISPDTSSYCLSL